MGLKRKPKPRKPRRLTAGAITLEALDRDHGWYFLHCRHHLTMRLHYSNARKLASWLERFAGWVEGKGADHDR
jgi:hypothetical protein